MYGFSSKGKMFEYVYSSFWCGCRQKWWTYQYNEGEMGSFCSYLRIRSYSSKRPRQKKMHIIWQKNAKVLYQKTSAYGSVCPGSATETDHGNCSCGTRNWATPQGDSKTHHHFGVHVFQTCKIGELRRHRFESRFQKFSEATKCVTVCDSLHELSSRQHESGKAKSKFQWRPQDVEGTKMSTEKSWRYREDLDQERGHVCYRQLYWRDETQIDTTAIPDHGAAGFEICPSGFQPYIGVILLPFWKGDIQIRVVGSMYFFIYNVTQLRECLSLIKEFVQWTFEQCSNRRTVGLLEVELNIFLLCEVVLSLWVSGVECYIWMFTVPHRFMRSNICCPTGGTALGHYENFERRGLLGEQRSLDGGPRC